MYHFSLNSQFSKVIIRKNMGIEPEQLTILRWELVRSYLVMLQWSKRGWDVVWEVAGCTGGNLSSPVPSGTNAVPAETPLSPDNQHHSLTQDNGTETVECTLPPKGETLTYRANITNRNKNPLTRAQFLEVNREYLSYLAKEIGQEAAEKMVNVNIPMQSGHPC